MSSFFSLPNHPSASPPHDGATTTKTVSTTSHKDLIEEIARQLRPWKSSESDLMTKIRGTIGELQSDFAKTPTPWCGFYSENKRYATKILGAIDNLKWQLTAPPESFFRGLLNLDQPEEIKELNDPDKLTENVADLSSGLTKLAVRCKGIIANRIGADRRADYKKAKTACKTLLLMLGVSKQDPTPGSPDSKFCFISSLIFEAATGISEQNLRRACQKVLTD